MMTTIASKAILIVDDNPTNLEVLSEVLTSAGFRIAVAIDGESAIKQVKYRLPELILLDVMMPGIDGFETCHRLKTDPATQGVPVIFTTALSDTENKVKGLSLGAVDYITKPFQEEEVIARVRTHLQLHNATRTLENQNDRLRQEVEQREKAEAALQESNQKLEQTLHHLQQTQMQMVQSEKMSALGQLVAGVAHEINNPVNFIYGNLEHASDYTHNLLELLNLYRHHCPHPGTEVQNKTDAIDLEFLVDDLPKLLASMKVGAERIRQIVTSLRIFSRLNETEMKPVDIHQGIDSTLMILQSRFKAKNIRADGVDYYRPTIEVVKEYGDLPLIECYSGQLNQVFMNILVNALDAIDDQNQEQWLDSTKPKPGCIQIRTSVLNPEQIMIQIADNGPGMAETLQQRLFDPFFTTKPVGKGTGLGLSISYQIIVDQHGGTLHCTSTPGLGTEFTITIPICRSTSIKESSV